MWNTRRRTMVKATKMGMGQPYNKNGWKQNRQRTKDNKAKTRRLPGDHQKDGLIADHPCHIKETKKGCNNPNT